MVLYISARGLVVIKFSGISTIGSDVAYWGIKQLSCGLGNWGGVLSVLGAGSDRETSMSAKGLESRGVWGGSWETEVVCVAFSLTDIVARSVKVSVLFFHFQFFSKQAKNQKLNFCGIGWKKMKKSVSICSLK